MINDEYVRWLLVAVVSILGGVSISPQQSTDASSDLCKAELKAWSIEYTGKNYVSREELVWKLDSLNDKLTQAIIEIKKEIMSHESRERKTNEKGT